MTEAAENFHAQVSAYIEAVYRATGVRLDLQLTGHGVADAVPIDIDPAMDAIVHTELLLSQRMAVDLRELVQAAPPVEGDNLFVTFSASSANFQGGNAALFGLHLTDLPLNSEIQAVLDAGVFVPGGQVSTARVIIVFVKGPEGEVSLAKTGVSIGLNPQERLVAYQTFQVQPGLASVRLNPPSRLAGADPQVILYVFLTLSAFMAVNQGEAPLGWTEDGVARIG